MSVLISIYRIPSRLVTGPFIMREFTGKQKHSGKSGRRHDSGKPKDAKHKDGARKHDRDRARAHPAGMRDESGHRHMHAHHARHDGRSSRIENYIVRGINILGLLVEWGLSRDFNAPQSGHRPHSSQAGGMNAAGPGASEGYGNAWPGQNPAPPPSYPGHAASFAAGRIVVCTGKSCQRRWESGNLVADLQREAARRGIQVEITTCGCMDFCDEAPLVTAAAAGGAGMSSSLQPERYFSGVGTRDVPNIIDSIMYRRT